MVDDMDNKLEEIVAFFGHEVQLEMKNLPIVWVRGDANPWFKRHERKGVLGATHLTCCSKCTPP